MVVVDQPGGRGRPVREGQRRGGVRPRPRGRAALPPAAARGRVAAGRSRARDRRRPRGAPRASPGAAGGRQAPGAEPRAGAPSQGPPREPNRAPSPVPRRSVAHRRGRRARRPDGAPVRVVTFDQVDRSEGLRGDGRRTGRAGPASYRGRGASARAASTRTTRAPAAPAPSGGAAARGLLPPAGGEPEPRGRAGGSGPASGARRSRPRRRGDRPCPGPGRRRGRRVRSAWTSRAVQASSRTACPRSSSRTTTSGTRCGPFSTHRVPDGPAEPDGIEPGAGREAADLGRGPGAPRRWPRMVSTASIARTSGQARRPGGAPGSRQANTRRRTRRPWPAPAPS